MKLIRYGSNVVATLVIGVLLSRYISNLPYEFPLLPASIADVMRKAGIDTVKNGDDIETIGLLVIIAVSLVFAALLVWMLNVVLRRWRLAHH